MPLVRTSRGTASGTTSASLNFTPSANSRTFVFGTAVNHFSTTPGALSITGPGYTWNSAFTPHVDSGSAYRARDGGWYADAGASPINVTVRVSSTNGQRIGIAIVEYTGLAFNALISDIVEGSSGSAAVNLGQPAAGNHMLSFVQGYDASPNSFTPDGGATAELFDDTLGAHAPFLTIAAQVRESGTYTSLTWTSGYPRIWAWAIEIEVFEPDLIIPQFDLRRRLQTSKLIGAC